jgi:tellurite resistance protein
MATEDDDPKKVQQEHGSYFSTGESDDAAPEDRYEPVEVDLNQPEPKKDDKGRLIEEPRRADTGAEELRAQLAQARQQTMLAQQQAIEAAQRAQFAEQRVMGSTVSMIDSAIDAANQQSAVAEAKSQAALDAADHRAAAAAQRELSDVRHNLLRLQEQKAMVEAEVRQPPQQQPRLHPAQQQLPPVEQLTQQLVNSGYPRSAEWLRAHPEWTARPELMKRVSSAHNHLVDNKGFVPETDEYFAALEQELGMGQQQRRTTADYSAIQRRGAAAPTNAAPSLRTGQPMMRSHVALTPAQREAAELSGMTDREYAAEFEAARVGGKLLGYR